MKRKGFIAEGDITLLLKRYDSSTILLLLHEIANYATANLDWDVLVRDSKTGISNPREYQALWRYLAYRREISDSFSDDPDDDESDLEHDVEAFPSVSNEMAMEATNYVTALMGCSLKNSSNTTSNFSEANDNSNTQAENLQNYYKANAERKKRKLWSIEEDEELAAGVDKYGEGSWAIILKNVFKHDRTASQLAQRWGLIKKRRDCNGTSTTTLPFTNTNDADKNTELPQPATTATLTATATACLPKQLTVAVPQKPPPAPGACVKVCSTTNTVAVNTATTTVTAAVTTTTVAKPITRSVAVTSAASSSGANLGRPMMGPDPMVQAAAVAAGARIAPASSAAALLKARSILHIRPGQAPATAATSTATATTVTATTSATTTATAAVASSSRTRILQQQPPVIHYIRTGAPPPRLSSFKKKLTTATTASKFSKAASNKSTAASKMITAAVTAVASAAGTATATATATAASGSGGVEMKCVLSSALNGVRDGSDYMYDVVDVDSDADDVATFGSVMGTSSNESFSHNNASSPLSHSCSD